MTRINIGIHPKKLHTQHLIAEHREIKRIPNLIAKGKANISNIPTEFTLGTGHVRFFYNKGKYLYNRYQQLHTECLNRNINVTDFTKAFDIYTIHPNLFNNYKHTNKDLALIKERLKSRKPNFYTTF